MPSSLQCRRHGVFSLPAGGMEVASLLVLVLAGRSRTLLGSPVQVKANATETGTYFSARNLVSSIVRSVHITVTV